MKTMNYLWAALTAAALSLSACQDNEVTNGNDDNAYPHEQVALSFNVDATVGITTRADDSSDHVTVPGNAFPDGATVGVYFAAKDATLDGLDGNNANNQYKTDATPSSPTTTVYWDDYKTALDIYAYSPYNSTPPTTNSTTSGVTAKTGFSWTVKTDQSTTDKVIASDLLISNNVRGLTYTQNKNAQDGKKILTFTHALAKLTINLVDNSGGTGALYTQAQLKAATAEIATQKTKADVIFVKTTDAAKDIKNTDVDATITPNKLATANTVNTKAAATSFEAICIPQDITMGTTIATIKVTNSSNVEQSYTVKAPADAAYTLQQGHNNILNVTISKTGIGLSFEVKDWTATASSQTVFVEGINASDAGDGGITSGTGITPKNNDKLEIAYLTDGSSTVTGDEKQKGTFTYNSSADGSWEITKATYWDDYEKGDASKTFTFAALYTPAANPATGCEIDYLAGTSAAGTYSTALKFTEEANKLKHIMSQFAIELKPGTGYIKNDLKNATVTLKSGYLTVNAVPTPGNTFTTKATEADVTLTHNTEAEGTGDNAILNTLVLCPQTWSQNAVIATIRIGTDPVKTYNITAKDAAFTLTAGQHTTLTVTVGKTGFGLSFGVTDWATNSSDGSGDFVDPVDPAPVS